MFLPHAINQFLDKKNVNILNNNSLLYKVNVVLYQPIVSYTHVYFTQLFFQRFVIE